MHNRIPTAASSNDNDNNTGGLPDADPNLCKPRNQHFNLTTSNLVLEHSVFDRHHYHSNDNDNNTGDLPDADPNLCKPRNQSFNLATSHFVLEHT